MFKVISAEDRRFTHDVTVMTPVDGGYDEEQLKVTYNYIDTEETRSFDLNTAAGTDAFIKRVVVRLDDLTDAKGHPITSTDELRDALMKLNPVRQSVVAGFFEATSQDGPRRGN